MYMENISPDVPTPTQSKGGNKIMNIVIGIVILFGGFFLGTQYRPSLSPIGGDGLPKEHPRQTQSLIRSVSASDVILGNPQAPVTIIEYSDFQCPFCKQFHATTGKMLREGYIAQGLVRFIYRDFPLDSIHPYARPAAEAARCARDQGAYWEFHDYLFDNQSQIPAMDFVRVAKSLGLNEAQFMSCVATRKYRDAVEADFQDGIQAGVDSTPTTFVNGVMVEIGGRSAGAAPYTIFDEIIRRELERAR